MRMNMAKHLAVSVIIAALLALPSPGARAQISTVSMDFSGVELPVFIKFISELTGRNFVIDSNVRGKVTVLSPQKVSVEEAYRVFESVLQVYGFMAVPAGEVTKIVPAKEGPTTGLPAAWNSSWAGNDTVLTQIIPLKYVQSEGVLPMLAPMVSKSGLITAYPPSDTLIVTDTRSNIDRILTIIRAIDVQESEADVVFLPLEYASASKTADQVTKIMTVGTPVDGKAPAVKLGIVPDERMNALIVYGEVHDVERVRRMVAELDKPTPKEKGNIRVHKLMHADAEELAAVLSGLVGKAPEQGESGTDTPAQAVISKGASIIPDTPTNSLVIISSPEDYDQLSAIIEELDVPRKQVLVEALIMEVSSDNSLQFGTQFNGGFSSSLGDESGLVGGFLNPSQLGTSLFNPVAPGFGLGAAAVPVTINGLTFSNLDALITFGKSQSSFNIISTPQVMTLDNQEASIVVAENRPFQTSESIGKNADDLTVQQFTYRDVGTTLRITPQINTGGIVKLQIYQEFSEIDSAATGSTGVLLPVTRKRTTETTVLVKEGQTVVLSGLIGKTSTDSISRVPGLSDIPLLGWLFKTKTKSERKTNLLIFISPHIVGEPKDAEDIYGAKMREFENIQFDQAERVKPLIKPLAATVRKTEPGNAP